MIKKYRVSSTEETERLGGALAKLLDERDVTRAFIAMRGEMGVGKTAFTRGFAAYFGIKNVKSPTYTVLNEYVGKCRIHHFDFYRMKSADEALGMGWDEYLAGGAVLLVEWADRFDGALMPEDTLWLLLRHESPAQRSVKLC